MQQHGCSARDGVASPLANCTSVSKNGLLQSTHASLSCQWNMALTFQEQAGKPGRRQVLANLGDGRSAKRARTDCAQAGFAAVGSIREAGSSQKDCASHSTEHNAAHCSSHPHLHGGAFQPGPHPASVTKHASVPPLCAATPSHLSRVQPSCSAGQASDAATQAAVAGGTGLQPHAGAVRVNGPIELATQLLEDMSAWHRADPTMHKFLRVSRQALQGDLFEFVQRTTQVRLVGVMLSASPINLPRHKCLVHTCF